MTDDILHSFHPAVRTWFERKFRGPTDAQALGWPQITSGRDTLISAPTGSGKTLAAFLVSIDRLIGQAEKEPLTDEVHVLYISPLKALSNDIRRNLEDPLAEIEQVALELGYRSHGVRTALRTGDTTQAERQQIVKNPPHILITTPESLYLMLTAERSREILRTVKTVIVDEIHALLRDKRGSHLALTLARLDHVANERPARIGLSATIKPIEDAACFLVGADRVVSDGTPNCTIVNTGHQRDLEIEIEIPPTDLEAVASGEQWRDTYDRLAELIKQHRTTLVFVNTRRLAERAAFAIAERLGEEHVGAHHGSLSKERRLNFEQRLKAGEMKALVATASLELGIDIGTIDLVCQLESPRSMTTFLQRVGRSGHALGLTPKGRLFPTTRDELVECSALVRAVKAGRLDRLYPPVAPLDILAQQIVAEAACEPWREDDLFALFRKADPYSGLDRHNFDEIVDMLSEGIPVGTGKAAAYLHRDRINGIIRGRRGARMTAIQCGGAIPEVADYRVLAEPGGTFVGTLDEDFSIESMAGDIILLGTTSWRIRRIEAGVVRVEDAHGQPPSVPFWLGEAPSRTVELSGEVSRLRQDIADRLGEHPGVETPQRYANHTGDPQDASFTEDGPVPEQPRGVSNAARTETLLPAHPEVSKDRAEHPRSDEDQRRHAGDLGASTSFPSRVGGWEEEPFATRNERTEGSVGHKGGVGAPGVESDPIRWLAHECNLPAEAAEQVVRYVRAERDGIGLVPTQQDVVFERFFDEGGGMQLVVHAPFGGRINRAWGLALRKRYCVGFDFELQAAASDDAMLLSIGANNSFPLTDMFDLVKPQWAEESVEQSLLVSPMFGARWRWNATRALVILRQRQGKKVPPQIQRMRADDLMAAVFPKLVGCQENQTGPIEIPDHPIVRQTVHDCMHEAMDIDGLKDVLDRIERGEIRLHAKDTTEPSPFAHEMLNSKPYTYLDDAPLEERRARAVTLRRSLPENSRDLGALDPDAIERVIDEARPDPRDPEELHELLLSLIAVRPPTSPISPFSFLITTDYEAWLDELISSGRAAIADTAAGPMWFAAENLPVIKALYRGATIRPKLRLPADIASRAVNEDDARLALFRGHMEIAGPVTIAELAERTAMAPAATNSVLAQLEGEGSVMRGQFTPGSRDEQFCDRRLLARIHRYTLDRLRQEIEPVTSQDLMRFLLRWQHVAPGAQLEGKRGLLEAITQLQGFDIPAVAWERHILPNRVAAYKGSWLDELCMSGDVAWGRLATKRNGDATRPATTSSATPISLVRRTDLPWLLAGIRNGNGTRNIQPANPEEPGASSSHFSFPISHSSSITGAGRDILDLLAARGALFYDDIARASGRLPTDVERGLWDLVARGLITADGFQALRSLMASTKRRNFQRPQRARLFRSLAVGLPSGRWSLLPHATSFAGEQHSAPVPPEVLEGRTEQPPPGLPFIPQSEELAETWAEQLLFRYGVVFRDLVQRENLAVPWRDILRALRRMEARGSVRGGRFVAGFYGEQYARPEAVESLRKVRRLEKKGELVRMSGVDPLNLTGTITPGPRVTAVHTRHVLYRDGVPLSEEETAQVLAEARVAKAG